MWKTQKPIMDWFFKGKSLQETFLIFLGGEVPIWKWCIPLAMVIGNIMIIHWNWEYPIFKQTRTFIFIYIYINRYIRISTIYTTERSYLYNPTSLTNWGTTLMHSSRSLPWFPGGPSANQSPIFLLVPMVKIPWNSIARGNSWCSWWYSIT